MGDRNEALRNGVNMNNLASAIDVLTQAQRMLQSRLAERIEESRESILADAADGHYSGEIDTLQDQLGGKLSVINQMLAALSFRSEAASPTINQPAGQGDSEEPDSTTDSASPVDQDAPANMEAFLTNIEEFRLDHAAISLSEILSLSNMDGMQCATFFARESRDNQQLVSQARQLESQVAKNRANDGIQSLHACFGLTGESLITAFETLRLRVAAS